METTTIAVTTEITLPKDPLNWQVQDLEAQILEKSLEAGRKAYLKALKEYEKHLIRAHEDWERKERPTKKLDTRLGKLPYERYRVWDRAEKRSRYPLDEILGIHKHERVSSGYKELIVRQAVQRSYRQSSREADERTMCCKSTMANWRIVQAAAADQKTSVRMQGKILDWKNLRLPDPPHPGAEDPCPALGIDVDDTYCRSWKAKRWLKDHQVRAAVLYRHKERVSKKRWRLKDKTVITSGPGETLPAFYNRVVQTAVTHYGLHRNTIVVVHGDGDPQIRNFARDYFVNALYRLDPWHVNKRIREGCGFKGKIPNAWYEDIYGKPDSLIAKIKTFHSALPKKDPQKQRVAELITYLQNNREGMLPSNVSQFTKKKHPRLFKRGSGTIERNIAWSINGRFKLAGMSWSLNGLENLLALREDFLNTEVKPTYKPSPGNSRDFLPDYLS